ncbi:hypothetical protein, partial [Lacticaseibacillus rhamnosus]|uniref:hypothetical protein n=1 Tax=Lacticaseibacillus rhamnosus TaxID=47715 RepID=UPI00237F469C
MDKITLAKYPTRLSKWIQRNSSNVKVFATQRGTGINDEYRTISLDLSNAKAFVPQDFLLLTVNLNLKYSNLFSPKQKPPKHRYKGIPRISFHHIYSISHPYGIRTRVSALRTRRL